ncbi:MAG: septum formation protein Maf [Bacilli bacterium]|nr:septum formation protein Maf [Bacilli bacterium]
MKIILASKSKRRKDLLNMMHINYEVVESDKEEFLDINLSPLENCINISLQKAIDVKNKTTGNRIIIACDTIVCKDNKIYGKPKDYKDAFEMLKILSNGSHEVISCLTVIKVIDNKEDIYQENSTCKVYIDLMTDKEINDWILNSNPYDKAGAYAIQEEFGKYITKVEGDYYTIVGLPINKLYRILHTIKNDE